MLTSHFVEQSILDWFYQIRHIKHLTNQYYTTMCFLSIMHIKNKTISLSCERKDHDHWTELIFHGNFKWSIVVLVLVDNTFFYCTYLTYLFETGTVYKNFPWFQNGDNITCHSPVCIWSLCHAANGILYERCWKETEW